MLQKKQAALSSNLKITKRLVGDVRSSTCRLPDGKPYSCRLGEVHELWTSSVKSRILSNWTSGPASSFLLYACATGPGVEGSQRAAATDFIELNSHVNDVIDDCVVWVRRLPWSLKRVEIEAWLQAAVNEVLSDNTTKCTSPCQPGSRGV
jgi:hypothetical protein